MPTENRSSNTEMVSVPRHMLERATDNKHLEKERISIHRHEALFALRGLLAQPPPQPHPEPIAWMVGAAFWWTKEEAERDAAATGLPIVGLGPMTGSASAEQHQGEPVGEVVAFGKGLHEIAWAAGRMPKLGAKLYTHADPGEVERLREKHRLHAARLIDERGQLRAQLAERDALLLDNSGQLIRMAAHLISAPLFALQDLQDEDKKMTRARVDAAVESADARLKDAAYELRRIADALSASAEPQVKS